MKTKQKIGWKTAAALVISSMIGTWVFTYTYTVRNAAANFVDKIKEARRKLTIKNKME